MYISDADKDRILERSADDLIGVIGEFTPLKKSGASFLTTCPKCGAENALNINTAKQLFKCFKCNEVKGKRPIDYLMSGRGMSFPDALQWLAEHYGMVLEPAPVKAVKKAVEPTGSFCSRMLAGSGLTRQDVMAMTHEGDDLQAIFQTPTFVPGTIDERGQLQMSPTGGSEKGDDVIIKYFDLEGRPQTYQRIDNKGREVGKEENFYRVRWQFPDEHKDKDGRPMKYRSPYGSSTHVYIPQRLRRMYLQKQAIKRLYIQEGEKKAEKACKHGIWSLGIPGIQNFGIQGGIPEEIVKIVEACQVKEICFLLDSDLFDLTTHIKIDDPIEKRPRNFFYAVKNYKEYCNSLKNRGFDLEIFFGYTLPNSKGEKGIDDLLVGTLSGHEEDLAKDLEECSNTKQMLGKYVQLYKITTATDSKIQDVWQLSSPQKFCERYKDQLKDLPYFTFGRHQFKFNDAGELESAQPVAPEEQFWDYEDVRGKQQIVYRYEHGLTFLYNRGFGNYKMGDTRTFIRIDNKVVSKVTVDDIRDFVMDFTRNCLKEDILEMILRAGALYLGEFQLSRMRFQAPQFVKPHRGIEHFYFTNCYWDITSAGLKEHGYDELHSLIWDDQRKNFSPAISDSLIDVTYSKELGYTYRITEPGKKCQFLKFLENASNFTWRKEQMIAAGNTCVDISPVEMAENRQHLIAKLCAMGYLLYSLKDRGVAKAVVAVDGVQSEVGISNGRTGKSLMGEMLRYALSTVYINGKVADPAHDQFIWTEVTEKTGLVFIDDVRKAFDFELLFADITGDWMVNYKGEGRSTIKFEQSPKIFITTNHMISGEGKSFQDRQWYIAFSDFYNETHKPVDDFGCIFFSEWDQEQWNLAWNLLAQCVRLYYRFGVVESPSDRIDQRRLRQEIGEDFMIWAEEYYSDESGHRNRSYSRSDLYDSLIKFVSMSHREKYYTPQVFKDKLLNFCRYKGYLYNPHKMSPDGQPLNLKPDGTPDLRDARHGVEYMMVADANYYSKPASGMPEELMVSMVDADGDESSIDFSDPDDKPAF